MAWWLVKPGGPPARGIANELTEATCELYLPALFEIGLVLFGITILANLLGQLFLRTLKTSHAGRGA